MKKICYYLMVCLAAVAMVSCSQKHDKTITDLKAAIDGESTASAKYAAFAEQAAKDSLFSIEALFKATSSAEAIHIKNHHAALTALGVTDYQAQIGKYDVKSTAENLQAAIDGETYEFSTMYPQFIKDAESEKSKEAVISFNYAQDAEKDHAKIYADALANISAPASLASVYFVCPKCGNVFVGTAPEACELCQTGAADFVEFKATVATNANAVAGNTQAAS